MSTVSERLPCERTPSILTGYTVHDNNNLLGSGSFAEVIEVKCGGQVYAAKKYYNVEAKKILSAYGQEIEIYARIRHPNIVSYYGLCKLEGSGIKVIVMEKMHEVLEVFLIDTKNITATHKFQILHNILLGLHHLHTRIPAIIHRDLTAANVLLDSKGVAKIADFGNSRMIDLNPKLSPQRMTSKPGTFDYMPPEGRENQADYNDRLDIFSFGHLSLFVMVQTQPELLPETYYEKPKKKMARTEIERRDEHIKEMKSKLNGGDKHPLYSIIVSCLNDEPDERPKCCDILNEFLLHKLA